MDHKVFLVPGLCLHVLCLLTDSGATPVVQPGNGINPETAVEFPAFCILSHGQALKQFDGIQRALPSVAGLSFINLCSDPNQFHVTVTIAGSYENNTAHMYLTVKDGSRIVRANIKQNANFRYNSYNEGGYDCESMAGVQTVVRNFGESLVIETGFASIIVNRDLNLHSYMVQNPRSALCGSCGHVTAMEEICTKSRRHGSPPKASALVEAPHIGEEVAVEHEIHWSYDSLGEGGPSHWGQVSSDFCDVSRPDSRQSPINIETETTQLDTSVPVPHYTVTNSNTQAHLVNSGHAPVLIPLNASCILADVPFRQHEYKLFGLHLHFGPNRHSGSEHTVNGKPYAGELHFVHYNNEYGGLGEAVKHSDGLAVVGVFLEVSDGTEGQASISNGISDFLEHLSSILHGHEESYMTIDMANVLPTPADLSSYYTYDGSLTTPSCDEIVRWIVLSKPWGITEQQLTALRLLRLAGEYSEPMGVHGNARPVAPLNGRTVIQRSASVAPLAQNTAQNGEKDAGSKPHHEVHWSYDSQGEGGPSHWGQISSEECDWTRPNSHQSPIDISVETTQLDTSAPVPGYSVVNSNTQAKLFNSGHSPVLVPVNASCILTGVPSRSQDYKLVGLHIHFGPDSLSGSEHTVNGKPYAGEVHFVHYNNEYGGLGEAVKHPDGLAVVGVFLEVSDGTKGPRIKPGIADFLDHISSIPHDHDESYMTMDMANVLPSNADLSSYYTYEGSLTTPACNEIVRWTVLSKPWGITEQQLEALRLLRIGGESSEPMGVHGNARPVAPLNDRIVYRRES